MLQIELHIGISTRFHKYGRGFQHVTPAEAGVQQSRLQQDWIPAFAGMTGQAQFHILCRLKMDPYEAESVNKVKPNKTVSRKTQ
ncbi:MAG TPA: hypothetical protein DCE18_09200 [Syntrophobacteraceae bacterium]|nr:hypothetical protein [Syntrophobacteraceae bacterium]